MSSDPQIRRDTIAQWAFDTYPILERFHLRLDDVEVHAAAGAPRSGDKELGAFVGSRLERAFVMAGAVTALGTRLFGRYGEGKGLSKDDVNRVKKDADAVSAYAMSEALWYLTRNLPENHAVMVSLGEGLMPKAGETPEMGSNPLLGFGRVYARPEVAKYLDRQVHRLLNEKGFDWNAFWDEIRGHGITVWGAAIDTLEGTSRFAQGAGSGALAVFHLFDQPLTVACPYEGYVGQIVLPKEVVKTAEESSLLLNFRTPRAKVLGIIQDTWNDVAAENVHVWTLSGPSREERLGNLWREWSELGVHLVEDGWKIPGGGAIFVDSGTYAPAYRVGAFHDDDGIRHVFLLDGYAASAEAIQGASLDAVLGTHTSMCLFSSTFQMPHDRERDVALLDPEAPNFAQDLAALYGEMPAAALVEQYRESLRAASRAGMPLGSATVTIRDFLPRKDWHLLAISGAILDDPYSNLQGIEETTPGTFRVTVRASSRQRIEDVTLTLRLLEDLDESRLVFSPLLDRFYAGQDYRERAVNVSDSGRLRNELQTLCLGALEYFGDSGIRVHFDRIPDGVMTADKKARIREVLEWYKVRHPLWFRWLEIAD